MALGATELSLCGSTPATCPETTTRTPSTSGHARFGLSGWDSVTQAASVEGDAPAVRRHRVPAAAAGSNCGRKVDLD